MKLRGERSACVIVAAELGHIRPERRANIVKAAMNNARV